MIDRSDPQWYKDAIIYQLHVKAFFDASGDGIGDFAGLMSKLDYIQDLGVNTIWLLPFYPSPLRDDGYDIADYKAINPAYGDLKDFKRFVTEAHRRGIRIITELVINHTSDQHPWFQKARKAKPGSKARDFYVWSDTDQKYLDTRIIFLDTETSNWTWDPVAQGYFWHRFYSHQPDLNFDNPRVLDEVVKVMHHWLRMGVDGLRLDAVPYLVEREGTNNENLPETHDILKKIRTQVDANYPDRMLLAEANQWPEDTRPYFGDGDECHMAFHFPLMPRLYMAIAQEERYPVTDIIAQTPSIPENCQWAVFLRNHDELTLEMVTDSERDYLWQTYAFDKRMRINLGIRRRLAPLLDNDRRKIELMNGLLMSMPGTPVIYYGDEIGMGDNYYLGDRDGVRTPMQWSSDRNGGFSRADPQALFLPPVMDPVYGYEALNVEAQQKSRASMLNWMRRMIAVRKTSPALGRGTISFLYPRNRKILAFLRSHDDEDVLCVYNLSRTGQAVELDLSQFRTRVPVEMSDRSAFPPIGDLPYMLTLPGHAFFWFKLASEEEAPAWHEQVPDPLSEFTTIVMTKGWGALEDGDAVRMLERKVLPDFLMNQRWYAAKDRAIQAVAMKPWGHIPRSGQDYLLTHLDVTPEGGDPQTYFFPLTRTWGEEHLRSGAAGLSYTIAKIRSGRNLGALTDASSDAGFARAVVEALKAGNDLETGAAAIRFQPSDELRAMQLPPDTEARRPTAEQSNVSVILGSHILLKIYRRLQAGTQPDIEVSEFLTETGYANTPPFLGLVDHVTEAGTVTALAAAFGFVHNQGNAWDVLSDKLDRDLDRIDLPQADETPEDDGFDGALPLIDNLGRRTAELHCAFATGTSPAFRPQKVTEKDAQKWRRGCEQQAKAAFAALKRARKTAAEDMRASIDEVLRKSPAIEGLIKRLGVTSAETYKMRHHGDYHLGQVLVSGNDVYIIDFEGEPLRPLAERRAKADPVRDVAGMLRSIDYVAYGALRRLAERAGGDNADASAYITGWRETAETTFLDAYRDTLGACDAWPSGLDATLSRLEFFLVEKALYEITYEAANRPSWLPIPLEGVRRILEGGGRVKS